mgnify:CR=1 FL=1
MKEKDRLLETFGITKLPEKLPYLNKQAGRFLQQEFTKKMPLGGAQKIGPSKLLHKRSASNRG